MNVPLYDAVISTTSIVNRRVERFLIVCGGWLLLGSVCAGEPNIFIETGDMMTARYSHTATLLANGKVLVAGGKGSGGNSVSSSELYDPSNGGWTPTGSLVNARRDHSAVLLPNGKVLVAGGIGAGGSLASAELYDPANGTWSLTGTLSLTRYYFTATLLPNGKVLVAGGFNSSGSLSGAEVYDSENGTWAPTGSLVNARDVHTATLLPDGKVLVAGGAGPTGASFQSAELYDPASGTWALTGSLVTEHTDHTATLLYTGKVLVAGWNACCLGDAELYDPDSGTWTSTANLITPRIVHTATLLPSGEVLIAAGDDDGFILGSGELYDPVSETWRPVSNEVSPGRDSHTATLLTNGQVLIAGGTLGHGLVWNSARLYIGGATPAPSPTPTQPPSPTATPTSTPVATPTPSATVAATPTPTSTPAAQAINLSTRMRVQTGDNAGIGGFIITGTKHVLLRAIGPSLTQSGVPDALADPVLELHGPGAFVTVINNNWRDDPVQEAAILATGMPPTNNLESAIDATLAPGAYTAIVRGHGNTSGVALVEVYDLSHAVASKLANISTRAFVDTGNDIVIAGFILGGNSGNDRVVVRGIGPSLTAAGVPDALADPILELRDGNGALLVADNDWQDDAAQAAELTAAGLAPTNDLESGIAAALPPGLYTALLSGITNGFGIGLVEVYDRGMP